MTCNFKTIKFSVFFGETCCSSTFLGSVSWQIFRALAIILRSIYFDLLPMSKSLVTSNALNLEVFIKYVVQLLFDVLFHSKFSEPWL